MKQAFTLIELSIVLIIIGLITAGIIGGQRLITNARLTATVSELNEIKQAISIFELEFRAAPGDFSDASDYWGADCHATPATCDGDGNGQIAVAQSEDHMVFTHLSLAEIYPGDFLGTNSFVGVDLPTSSLGGTAGYAVFQQIVADYGVLGPSITLGESAGTSTPFNSILSPRDGKNLDFKIDDGIASTGNLLSFAGENETDNDACVIAVGGGTLATPDNNSVAGDVDYNVAQTDVACIFNYYYEGTTR